MTNMTTIEHKTGTSVMPQELESWKAVGKTGSITRRFEFPDYAATSAFLDEVNALSEETEIFPDLGFARTYVNVTIPECEGRDMFARCIDKCHEGAGS